MRILELLRDAADGGLGYSQMKTSVGVSDTALSKFLRRLQYNRFIEKKNRRYHVAKLGSTFLMNLKPIQIQMAASDRAKRKRELIQLWDQVRRLHLKILQKKGLSPLLRVAIEQTGLLYVGALRTRDGKRFISIKTPDLEELRRLGWMGEEERKAASARF